MNALDNAFRGKVVIVTGGTSGIGRELVLQLAEFGAVLYICARNPKRGEDLVKEVRARDVRAVFKPVDVQDAAQVEKFVSRVVERESRIDYLFHMAGTIMGGEIRDHEIRDIDKVLKTNVLGTAYMSYYVYRAMASQGGASASDGFKGHIINVASAAGLFPLPLMGVYSASKFAVYGFTEALRMEARGLGVRVSTVAPGIVDTPIYETGIYSKTDKGTVIKLFKRGPHAMTASKAAQKILKGTVHNRAVIFTQVYPHLYWLLYRFAPHLFRFLNSRYMGSYRKRLRKSNKS